jgi:hypothetical protein
MQSISLLKLAIRDTCNDFIPVNSIEEADTIITLENLQKNILIQLGRTLNDSEKKAVTLNMLKSELTKNNLFSTEINTDDGMMEVWLVKKQKQNLC